MRGRFLISRPTRGAVAGAHAVIAGARERSGLREMISENLGLVRHQFGEAPFKRMCNALMPFAPPAQEQALIGGIPHQRVLEAETSLQAAPFRKDDARRDELVECSV